MQNDFKNNHYVPQWYQKRFVEELESQSELFRLDLSPQQFRDSKNRVHIGNSVRRLGFSKCFVEPDLYTATVNGVERKDIEKIFFGEIDRCGNAAIEWCDKFSHPWNGENHVANLLLYMSTQKLRTPKGLVWLKEFLHLSESLEKESLLIAMTRLRALFNAIWMECVWQIADADASATKFIISDHPVTIYNRRCGPRSTWCRGARDPDIRFNGSHTIFPLSLNKVLILTNLSWVRNPYQSEITSRPNPTFFRNSLMKILDIQTLRHLSENEVLQINFILKCRAYKYIAAAKEVWLYPEKHVSKSDWAGFGNGYLFMPDPRPLAYGGEVVMGYSDGSFSASDEYGHQPGQKGYRDTSTRVGPDWHTFQRFKGEFARLFGPYRRGRSCSFDKIDNEKDDDSYHQYHLDLEKNHKRR